MDTQFVTDIMTQAFRVALLLAAPGLGIALVIGIIVSIFQTVTSINEQTLVFVPKMVGVGFAILFFLSWMISVMITFTEQMLLMIPTVVH